MARDWSVSSAFDSIVPLKLICSAVWHYVLDAEKPVTFIVRRPPDDDP